MRIVLSNASVKWGGVHVFTELLSRGLLSRGHDVTIFGAPGSILEERMKSVAPFEPILRGMDLHPVALWHIQRALARSHADVVLALMKKDVRLTVPAAWARGIPSVVRHANDRPLTGWIYDQILFGRLPALHIANSTATRATLLGARWLRPEAVKVVYNGIDPAPIDSAVPARLGLPDGAAVIGFAGRLERRKGLLDLMRAWPGVAGVVPNAHLVIAGKGPDEAEAREILGNAPRVHWLGYRSDIPSLLRAFDIAVVPSHWEGFGFIAAEAMVAGLPVVAADASSLPEIVRDGIDGILVPAHDPLALAGALTTLSRDAGMRARMGAAGRTRAQEQFGIDRMVDEYEQILESVRR
ncbi:MAG: glycosyltransferase family 4 protein [Gemmatimonadaceae bacterium]